MKLGILHPGNMGVSVAASAIAGGHQALWASEGRGRATHERADEHGLTDVGTIGRICDECAIVVSVCPPASALSVAEQVAATGYSGIYVDANAISPTRMAEVAQTVAATGATVVDGGIIGPPAWRADTTWLHLSGEPSAVNAVSNCFVDGPMHTAVVSERIGDASALKMCYAAVTKGSMALVCAVLGAAEQLGVREALESQWDADQSGLASTREAETGRVTAKAWRFVDELEEIARTFEGAGQPGGFHFAAAEVYRRLAPLKDGPHPTPLPVVLSHLVPEEHK